MTLKEIAAQAGVSISTVSRIINSPDDSFASKSVRDRVWAIIEETGYIPNQNARELKQGKQKISIPGSIACILDKPESLEENPFFAALIRAIEQQAMEQGYSIRPVFSAVNAQPNIMSETLDSCRIDGVIVISKLNYNHIRRLEKKYRNIVYVGRNAIAANCDQIICDGYAAAQTALKHLIDYGHQRIAYIGETANEVSYQAYLDTIHEYRLASSVNLVSHSRQDGTGGYVGAKYLLQNMTPLPTAVFCSTDITAITALRYFAEARIKVPEQISIIGIDNIERSGYVSPMLSTIEVPLIEMSNIAVQTLIHRIHKHHKLPLKIFLPHRLIKRESILNLNAGAYI